MPDDTRAEKTALKVRHAPVDLDIIKDDLGIRAGDTSQDEWLQRRIDGVWARMAGGHLLRAGRPAGHESLWPESEPRSCFNRSK